MEQTNSTDAGYNAVTAGVVAELESICGPAHVLFGDPDRLRDSGHDEVAGAQYAHLPDVVVLPDSALQISHILRLANRSRIPVTPRGAGSGLSGGAVPRFGGILLSTERLNRIL